MNSVSSGSTQTTLAEVRLQDLNLWRTFHSQVNEMIVTKNGRRMFPVIRISISGLDPRAMYSIAIEFVQLESHRWKYQNGEWQIGGKSEPSSPRSMYEHPDAPNFGSHWMKDLISFTKAKLTNKPTEQQGQVVLNSLHKYQPRIHVIRLATEGKPSSRGKMETFEFVETQFIAVTAYQNENDVRDRPTDVSLATAVAAHYSHQHSHQYLVNHSASRLRLIDEHSAQQTRQNIVRQQLINQQHQLQPSMMLPMQLSSHHHHHHNQQHQHQLQHQQQQQIQLQQQQLQNQLYHHHHQQQHSDASSVVNQWRRYDSPPSAIATTVDSVAIADSQFDTRSLQHSSFNPSPVYSIHEQPVAASYCAAATSNAQYVTKYEPAS